MSNVSEHWTRYNANTCPKLDTCPYSNGSSDQWSLDRSPSLYSILSHLSTINSTINLINRSFSYEMKKKKKKSHQYDGSVNSTLLSNGDHKKWHTKKKSKLLFKNVVDTERWKEIFKVCGSDSTLDIVPTAHFTPLWQFASTKQTFSPHK